MWIRVFSRRGSKIDEMIEDVCQSMKSVIVRINESGMCHAVKIHLDTRFAYCSIESLGFLSLSGLLSWAHLQYCRNRIDAVTLP